MSKMGCADASTRRENPCHLGLLVCSGLVLILVCCYWNRIALGGTYGDADAWVVDLARPVSVLYESLVGPIESDPEGLPQIHRITQIIGSWLVATVAYFMGVLLVLRRPASFAGTGFELIVAVSVLCRIIPVFSPPMLETDPCRYLWDGASVANGINPYRYAPAEVLSFKLGRHRPDGPEAGELAVLARLSDHHRLNWHFMHINHPAVPTIYPPLAQVLFSLAYRIAPGEVMVEKALVALLDVGILCLVTALLPLVGQPRCLVLIYGWCPMVLKEYIQTGHYDPVATLCLLGSLYLLVRGYRVLGGVYLGLAALGKLYPLVVLPALIRRIGWQGTLSCLLTILLLWAPYLGIGSKAFEGLRVYNREWVMNASVFSLVRENALRYLDAARADAKPTEGGHALRRSKAVEQELQITSLAGTKLVMGLILLPFLCWLAVRPDTTPRQIVGKAFAAVAALFILSPVGNPWYCAWLLPFAALFGRVSWVVLSSTMVGYYAFWTFHSYTLSVSGLPWPIDLRLLEYGPFFLILIVEEWIHRTGQVDQGPTAGQEPSP